MTKRKLTIPILLVLTLSILSQTLVQSATGAGPKPWISIDPASTIDITKTSGNYIITVKTNYTGSDIWGYQLALTYNPLILNGVSVTNGDLITNPPHPMTFVAGGFDNDAGELSLTGAWFGTGNATSGTGTSILATVNFTIVGLGDTPITIGPETKLIDVAGETIVDAHLNFNQIGHGYFCNVDPIPTHDVAATGIAFHNSIPTTTTYNETQALIHIDATIENQGDVLERFDVSWYYEIGSYPTLIESQTVTVANGTSSLVSASLNTTGFPLGFLTIIVEASKVYNETETIDNTYTTTLLIKLMGDIAGDPNPPPSGPLGPADGDVDWFDFGEFAGAYGSSYPQARYNVECDFDRDGDVDWFDFGTPYFASHYGKSVPSYKTL
jgi:hypothetical protein